MLEKVANRIILAVPNEDYYEVGELGASWNNKIHRWYITDDTKQQQFSKWLPPADLTKDEEPTMIYAPIFLIRSYETCSHCGKKANVWCLAASQIKLDDDKIKPQGEGEDVGSFLLKNVSYLPKPLLLKIQEKTRFLFMDKDDEYDWWYYANHCNHCRAKFSDEDLFEINGAFIAIAPEYSVGVAIEEIFYEGEFEVYCQALTTDINLIWELAERR